MKTFVILAAMTIAAALTAIACGGDKPASDPSSMSTTEATASAAPMTSATGK